MKFPPLLKSFTNQNPERKNRKILERVQRIQLYDQSPQTQYSLRVALGFSGDISAKNPARAAGNYEECGCRKERRRRFNEKLKQKKKATIEAGEKAFIADKAKVEH
ncbi:hypothetical protein ACFX12_023859 [Malus domestica]